MHIFAWINIGHMRSWNLTITASLRTSVSSSQSILLRLFLSYPVLDHTCALTCIQASLYITQSWIASAHTNTTLHTHYVDSEKQKSAKRRCVLFWRHRLSAGSNVCLLHQWFQETSLRNGHWTNFINHGSSSSWWGSHGGLDNWKPVSQNSYWWWWPRFTKPHNLMWWIYRLKSPRWACLIVRYSLL